MPFPLFSLFANDIPSVPLSGITMFVENHLGVHCRVSATLHINLFHNRLFTQCNPISNADLTQGSVSFKHNYIIKIPTNK